MVNGFTEDEIIGYVTGHDDGFEYAQLQTGISRFDLENLLRERGFEICYYCGEYWATETFTDEHGFQHDACPECINEFNKYSHHYE